MKKQRQQITGIETYNRQESDPPSWWALFSCRLARESLQLMSIYRYKSQSCKVDLLTLHGISLLSSPVCLGREGEDAWFSRESRPRTLNQISQSVRRSVLQIKVKPWWMHIICMINRVCGCKNQWRYHVLSRVHFPFSVVEYSLFISREIFGQISSSDPQVSFQSTLHLQRYN